MRPASALTPALSHHGLYAPADPPGEVLEPTKGRRGASAPRRLRSDYVIPVLSGFALNYHCDDEHVAQVGAQLLNACLDRMTRSLEYELATSLADEDRDPAFDATTQVMLLKVIRTDRVPHWEPPLDELGLSPSGMLCVASTWNAIIGSQEGFTGLWAFPGRTVSRHDEGVAAIRGLDVQQLPGHPHLKESSGSLSD